MEYGVRTRARTLAMAASSSSTNRKRKAVDLGEAHTHITSSPPPCRRFARNDEVRSSVEILQYSGEKVHPSRCSSNGSSELVDESLVMRSVTDLHSKSLPNESSTCLNCSNRRDITPSPTSSFREKSDDPEPMESSSVARSSNISKDNKISPLEKEIDEFFSRAEKKERQRFADKYNYDIVKDVPLEEGRYEWVRLNP